MNKKEIFQFLLGKYQAGTCTELELQQLLQLMKDDVSLYDQLDETVNHDWWEESLKSNSQIPRRQKKLRIPLIKGIGFWSAAASVVLLITGGIIWWVMANTGEILYQTDFGERMQIELPDGSQVELNANSQLTWNKNWKRLGIRAVVLEGEAYFDVVKSKNREFQVNTGEVLVKVLGTSFNVSNRRGETEVFLQKGKVQLSLPDKEGLTMVPGEKVEYKSDINKVTTIVHQTLHSAAAWKTGVIAFQKVPLKRILPELNDIYGIELVCTNVTLNETIMDVGVPYMNWEATKEALELAMKVKIVELAGKFVIETRE